MRTLAFALLALPGAALFVTPLCAQTMPTSRVSAVEAGSAAAVARTAEGRLAITAVAAKGPVRIDGVLDDEVWAQAQPVGGFVQAEPREGQPASQPTEVRIAYDDEFLYIGAYLYDTDPAAAVINDIRRDFSPDNQDTFEVLLDTFGDRRNGYVFITNPVGGRSDRQVADEGREINTSWDAVWSVRTQRVSDGWTLEMAIPFRSLRFDPEGGDWGINFSRRIRRNNEITFWSPVARAYNLNRVSLAGSLVGLPTTRPGRDLRVKPYALGRTLRNTGGDAFAHATDFGVDLKYGLTPSLTLDLTANPDFAQAEADEQSVNLSQFSQFFPEKREFFLENSGIFYVGDAARSNRVRLTPTPDEDLLLFFSRRIGLTRDGREIPIAGGARLTGQVAGMTLGVMSVQTREAFGDPADNYTVVRARKNLFSGSDVGVIGMSRQGMGLGTDYNRVYGVDGNFRFLNVIDWNSYVIRTETPGIDAGEYAFRSSLKYEGNRFHIKNGVMQLGEGFNNDLGYYRRTNVRKWFLESGVRPRYRWLQERGVRELHPHVNYDYFEDLGGRIVGKRLHNGFSVFFNSGGFTELSYNPEYQRIEQPLRLNRNVAPIPAGGYAWSDLTWRITSDQSRVVSATGQATVGGLWSGTQRTLNGTVSIRPSYRLRSTFGMQRTAAKLDTPQAEFVTTLLTTRANYSFNTNMFLDGLLQYDPTGKQFNANLRFNLIHRPLSDIYIVLNEQRIFDPVNPIPPGRSVILKYTQMFSF